MVIDNCLRHTLRITIGITMLALLLTGGAGAATLTVDDSGGSMYTKIQDAIDNASAGDTILVYSGTYYENVNVSKQLILRGIDSGGGMPVVNVVGIGSAAIELNAGSSTLEGIAVMTSLHGIGICVRSNNNTIKNNTASNNINGIDIYDSSDNLLVNNNIWSNANGINLNNASNNTLKNNNVMNTKNFAGLSLWHSSNNTLIGNNASLNIYGIYLQDSSNNMLINNTVKSNNYSGIALSDSNSNIVDNNTANLNNGEGMYIDNSTNNALRGNIANLNNYSGIFIDSSSFNVIYNNIFNNTNNFRFYGTIYSNHWNFTKTIGTNIIGGSYLGGNVWANPSGTGFSQTCADDDSDGICDSPYTLESGNIDYLPLALQPATGQLATITISPSPATISLGQTQQFTATGRDTNGNIVSITPTWSSSNTTVGTINAAGIFTALAAGTTTIIATSGSISGTATMTVSTGVASGTITGTVTGAATGAVIAGATVSATGVTATTDASGTYTLAGVPGGIVTVIVSNSGYNTASANVIVIAGATVTQNFALQPTPPVSITTAIWDEEAGSPLPFTWDSTNFNGFNVSGTGTETLRIVQTDLGAAAGKTRTIKSRIDLPGGGLIYTTTRQLIEYEVSKNKGLSVEMALDSTGSKGTRNNFYAKVNWLGEPFVALNGKASKLTKLVLEQKANESNTLLAGDSWIMGDGIALTLISIDAGSVPKQALLQISKDGAQKDVKIINEGNVYTFVEPSIAGEVNVPIFATSVDNISVGSSGDFVVLSNTWLISENITQILSGDTIGVFKVVGISDSALNLENNQSIILAPGSTINLAGNLKFKVLDNVNFLKFLPVSAAIVRGDVNGNGAPDVGDGLFTLQAVAGLRQFNAAQTATADVNGNGVMDVGDGLFILQAVAGLRAL